MERFFSRTTMPATDWRTRNRNGPSAGTGFLNRDPFEIVVGPIRESLNLTGNGNERFRVVVRMERNDDSWWDVPIMTHGPSSSAAPTTMGSRTPTASISARRTRCANRVKTFGIAVFLPLWPVTDWGKRFLPFTEQKSFLRRFRLSVPTLWRFIGQDRRPARESPRRRCARSVRSDAACTSFRMASGLHSLRSSRRRSR